GDTQRTKRLLPRRNSDEFGMSRSTPKTLGRADISFHSIEWARARTRRAGTNRAAVVRTSRRRRAITGTSTRRRSARGLLAVLGVAARPRRVAAPATWWPARR